MATIMPVWQKNISVPNNRLLLITKIQFISEGDTLQLPPGANTSNDASCKQLQDAGSPTVTIGFDAGTGIATFTDVQSDKIYHVASLHVAK